MKSIYAIPAVVVAAVAAFFASGNLGSLKPKMEAAQSAQKCFLIASDNSVKLVPDCFTSKAQCNLAVWELRRVMNPYANRNAGKACNGMRMKI